MPASNYPAPPRPPSCRFISRGKIFTVSPLGLFVERKDEYEKAHLQNKINEPPLWLYRLQFEFYGVSNIRIFDRISAYKAKRDKLEGIL